MSVLDTGIVLRCIVNDWQEQKLFGGLRKVVTYLVTVTKHQATSAGSGGSGTKPEQFCAPVRRRYSDFDWLVSVISRRYRGVWLPPLPEKNMINTAEAFIKERMARLDQFLNRLLGNPYMRHDTALQAFLTIGPGRKWDSTKKEHDKAEQSVRDVNNLQFARPPKTSLSRGLTEWFDRLDSAPEPPDTETAMHSAKAYFSKYEALLRAMVEATSSLVKTTEDYSNKLNDIQEALGEYNTAISKSSFSQLQTADIMMPISDAFQQWHSFQDAQTNATNLFWDKANRDELQLVRSFLNVIAAYDTTAKQQQDLVVKKDRAFSDLQKAKSSGKGHVVSKVEGQLKDLEAKVMLAEKMRKREAKAIISIELQRFADWRQVFMRRRVGQYAAIQLAGALKARAQWQSLARELGSDSLPRNDDFAVLPFRCDSFGLRSETASVSRSTLQDFGGKAVGGGGGGAKAVEEKSSSDEDEEEEEEQSAADEEEPLESAAAAEEDSVEPAPPQESAFGVVEDEDEDDEEEEEAEDPGLPAAEVEVEVEAEEEEAEELAAAQEDEEDAQPEEEEAEEDDDDDEEEGEEIDLGGDDSAARAPAGGGDGDDGGLFGDGGGDDDGGLFGEGDEDDDPFGEDVSMM